MKLWNTLSTSIPFNPNKWYGFSRLSKNWSSQPQKHLNSKQAIDAYDQSWLPSWIWSREPPVAELDHSLNEVGEVLSKSCERDVDFGEKIWREVLVFGFGVGVDSWCPEFGLRNSIVFHSVPQSLGKLNPHNLSLVSTETKGLSLAWHTGAERPGDCSGWFQAEFCWKYYRLYVRGGLVFRWKLH